MSTKKQAVEPTPAEQAPEVGVPTSPELTIQDLGNLRAVIDVATQRGAFKAAEMQAVGTVFNKLNDFLNAVSPAQSEGEEQAAEQQVAA